MSKPTFQNCTIAQLLAIFEENKAIPQLKHEVEILKMIIEDKKDVIREMEKENKALKEELREAKKENKLHNLALEVCNAMDLESEEEVEEAYTEFCAYRSERIHKDPIQEQLFKMQAQSEAFKAQYSSLIENHIVEETVVEVTPQEAC